MPILAASTHIFFNYYFGENFSENNIDIIIFNYILNFLRQRQLRIMHTKR